jgi:hypothetical protein
MIRDTENFSRKCICRYRAVSSRKFEREGAFPLRNCRNFLTVENCLNFGVYSKNTSAVMLHNIHFAASLWATLYEPE